MTTDGPARASRLPLSVTWREWLARTGWHTTRPAPEAFDAIVVGSGYGGSVAALRLAQKGYRTLLLERGSEYLPGEFPNDLSLVPKAMRINMPGQELPMGRASGLLETHVGLGMVAITGNGLGGGSLVNAGVVFEPDRDVFSQASWPAAIRHDVEDGLREHFDRALGQLQAHEWDSTLRDGYKLHKTVALQRFADEVGGTAMPVRATIDPARCVRCGDCASGCNVEGAKKTLATTYLEEALGTGRVQIVTQAEVYRFEREDRECSGPWWRVHVFSTESQHHYMAPREVPEDAHAAATQRTISAPLLFLCAGTLGTTQLMQRSQVRSDGPLRLRFSPVLGTRVSGNGDSLSWLADEPAVVASLGKGQAGVEAFQRSRTPKEPFEPTMVVGPTITAAVDLRKQTSPLDERLLVQDGAVPRAIAPLYRELLATAHGLRQLDAWWPRRLRHPGAAFEDPLAASEGRAQQAQVLLVMGHDGSPARLVWQDGDDRSTPWLPDPQDLQTYKRQQLLFDRFGDRHVHSPLWRLLPGSADKLMSGPKPPQSVLTVHPLGGCVMGDGPLDSVVDHLGRAWVHDPGQFGRDARGMDTASGTPFANSDEPRVYRGLFLLDGSIVPSSLGCNPLLTITALAERSLARLPKKAVSSPPGLAQRGEARCPQAFPSRDLAIDATLHEVLVARSLDVRGALATEFGSQEGSGRLEASFLAEDLQHDLCTSDHEMQAQAQLWLGALDADGRPGEASVRYVSVGGGRFRPLPATVLSGGPFHFIFALLQLGALAAAAVAVGKALASSSFGLAVALLLLVCVGVVVLPSSRSMLTWFILRGSRDIREKLRDPSSSWSARLKDFGPWALSLLRQMIHAAEKRVMLYDIPMRRQTGPGRGGLPAEARLLATKTVMYRASLAQFIAWALHRQQRRDDGTLERVQVRPTVWEQVMDAELQLVAGGRVLAKGTFRMGFENLTSSGMSSARRNAKGPIELGCNGDSTKGMVVAAGYALLFVRMLLKTRLLDFRLPTYSKRPRPDVAPAAETALRAPAGPVPAELHWVHDVPRGASSSDQGDDSTGKLKLQLRRYRQRDASGQPVAAEIVQGSWMGVPVARAKAVLLLHAFGQSGYSFTLDTVRENLAEHFYRQGYEVWVLETRMSTRSGHAQEPCTVDQIAAYDIPCAIRFIRERLEHEVPVTVRGPGRVQVAAFAQCIGSAALWMALLSGRLSFKERPAGATGRSAPRLSMLSHAMFSQVHPLVVGSRGTQAKTWVPALLQVLARRGSVPFAVRGPQDGVLWSTLDRLFASMPTPRAERRRPDGDDDGAATCRRIRFVEAPLFRHENINAATMAKMNLLFGDANLRLFAHARRFVDRERLVDEDGTNQYVNDAAVQRHLAFPVQLLHGEDNELFHVDSAVHSFALLGQFHRGWQEAFCQDDGAECAGALRVPGYGHVDVLIGQRASDDVFPAISRFFARCHDRAHHAAEPPMPGGWVARAPRLGPFLGWLRDGKEGLRIRVSFALDDTSAARAREPCPPVVLRRLDPATGRFIQWLPGQLKWRGHDAKTATLDTRASHRVAWRFVWADIPLPTDAQDDECWQVFTLHPTWHHAGNGELLGSVAPGDAELDRHLAWLGSARPSGSIEPPVTLGPHDLSRSAFQLRKASTDSLPADRDVTFAASCCRYPGLGIDRPRVNRSLQDYLDSVRSEDAAFAVLLGDQIYADATAGLVDPSSPVERYYERHAAAFDRDGLGALLARMPAYMTPDDHEWTDNYPAAAPLVKERWPQWSAGGKGSFREREQQAFLVAARAITAFERLPSPMHPNRKRPAAHYHFGHGAARFFMLDVRYARKRDLRQIMARHVLQQRLRPWLLNPAAQSRLNIIVSGSVVLPGLRPDADPASPGASDTWQYAEAQRRELLDLLVDLVPGNFLLLSGDYHVSGAVLVQRDGRTVGAAIVAPPLYAPLPYANATPDSVWVDEHIVLPGGSCLDLGAVPQGDFARGSGVATIQVRRTGGGMTVSCDRTLWCWERGEQARMVCELVLPGGTAARVTLPPAAMPAPAVAG